MNEVIEAKTSVNRLAKLHQDWLDSKVVCSEKIKRARAEETEVKTKLALEVFRSVEKHENLMDMILSNQTPEIERILHNLRHQDAQVRQADQQETQPLEGDYQEGHSYLEEGEHESGYQEGHGF